MKRKLIIISILIVAAFSIAMAEVIPRKEIAAAVVQRVLGNLQLAHIIGYQEGYADGLAGRDPQFPLEFEVPDK